MKQELQADSNGRADYRLHSYPNGNTAMTDIGSAFIGHSRRYLREELAPRIRASVEQLSEEEIWWRPNEASNSIGNLVLHLSGNVGQWIVSGVGGFPDNRQRQTEFDERGPIPTADLLARLERTLNEADAALASLIPAQLLETRVIQEREVSVLEAVYHVVEHFSMHTGQIAYIAKMRLARDLGFYEVVDGTPWPAWPRPDMQ